MPARRPIVLALFLAAAAAAGFLAGRRRAEAGRQRRRGEAVSGPPPAPPAALAEVGRQRRHSEASVGPVAHPEPAHATAQPSRASSAAPDLRLFEVPATHAAVAALAAAIDVAYLDADTFEDMDALLEIAERLERAAAELRRHDLEPGRAAELVDECARLATEAGGELERRVRAGDAPPGQLSLGA